MENEMSPSGDEYVIWFHKAMDIPMGCSLAKGEMADAYSADGCYERTHFTCQNENEARLYMRAYCWGWRDALRERIEEDEEE